MIPIMHIKFTENSAKCLMTVLKKPGAGSGLTKPFSFALGEEGKVVEWSEPLIVVSAALGSSSMDSEGDQRGQGLHALCVSRKCGETLA